VQVIGLDIGGTSVKGMIVTSSGSIQAEFKQHTNILEGREGILQSAFSVVDTLLSKIGHNEQSPVIQGIGIGSAGRIDPVSGNVVFATENLPGWQGTQLKQTFEERYRLPVSVDNDANTALVGELWRNTSISLNKKQGVVMLTLGTGVGGANVMNGQLVTGSHYQGGEWGHIILVPGGRECNCGKYGCLEQYLSGTALITAVNKATGRSYTNGSSIFEDFTKQDKTVEPIIHQFIYYLAIMLENISTSIDPKYILLGGGVLDSKDHWWHLLEQQLHTFETKAQVLPAMVKNQAGMYGAASQIINILREKKVSIDETT